VPHAGQRAWGRLLRSLGGEYADIASLAYAQEEQCTQLLDAEGDDDDIHFEQTYEDEEE